MGRALTPEETGKIAVPHRAITKKCDGVRKGMGIDNPCFTCGHRADSHTSLGTCDVCDTITYIILTMEVINAE